MSNTSSNQTANGTSENLNLGPPAVNVNVIETTDLNMTQSNVSHVPGHTEMVDVHISHEVGSSSSSLIPRETTIPPTNTPIGHLPFMSFIFRNLEDELPANLTNTSDVHPSPSIGTRIAQMLLQMNEVPEMPNSDIMTFENLLALEERLERVGSVLSELSEEAILSSLQQKKIVTVSTETPSEAQKCCICQAEYNEGEDIGKLDCGHEFHTNCITEWLKRKNVCPLCKRTAVEVPKKEETDFELRADYSFSWF